MRPAAPAFALLLAVLVPGAARAGDGVGEPVRLELDAFRAPPAVRAARALWTPADAGFEGTWSVDDVAEDAALATFEPPLAPDLALSSDAVEDLVRRLVPESGEPGWASRVARGAIELWAPPAAATKARTALAFVEQAMAPRLAVRATLLAPRATSGVPPEDGGPRLLAAGAVRLLPRRWTSVWTRTEVRRSAVAYDVQIAQETVASRPRIAALPEGEQLLLRWSPGEKATLLEVWAAESAHRPAFPVDLSVTRHVPESNAPATVALPRTAVRRVATAVVVDAAKGGAVELSWDGPDGARTLRLAVDAAPAAPADVAVTAGAVGVVRAGAAAAALDDGARESALEDLVRSFQAGAGGGRSVASPETFAGTFLLCEGAAEEVVRLRAHVGAAERALVGATVELRCVVAPSGALRDDVEAGRVAVGAALDAAVAAPYLRAPVHASARVGVVSGVPARLTSAASVAGLTSADAEVAQQAGALTFDPRARLDGFEGRVRLDLSGASAVLRVTGTVAWARPDGGSVEVAYRRPLSMSSSDPAHVGGGPRLDDPSVRRATIPLEAHGSSAVDAEVRAPSAEVADGRWWVLALASRPGADGAREPLLLLASVR